MQETIQESRMAFVDHGTLLLQAERKPGEQQFAQGSPERRPAAAFWKGS